MRMRTLAWISLEGNLMGCYGALQDFKPSSVKRVGGRKVGYGRRRKERRGDGKEDNRGAAVLCI
jgi:hypothetical protein